jgi:DNA repair exonuclease SbcCD nuclease subunit
VLASDRITVADTVSKFKVGHLYVCTVPYTHDLDQAKKDLHRAASLVDDLSPHVLLAHLGIQGARVGSDYVLVSDTDIGVGDIPRDKFNACFFGHFHEHQLLFENGWFVGATLQHNWGDACGSRGFLDVTVTDAQVSVTQIPTCAPKFITVRYEDALPSYGADFVRILLPEGVDTAAVQEKYPTATLVPSAGAASSEEFELTETQLSPEAALVAWVGSRPPLDNVPDVLRIGQELLQRARGTTA